MEPSNRLTEILPPRLYRTHYPSSNTSNGGETSFLAVDTTTFITDRQLTSWSGESPGAHLRGKDQSSSFVSTPTNRMPTEN